MTPILEKFVELIKVKNNIDVCVNEPMKKHTSFKVGGPADVFVQVYSTEDAVYVLERAKELGIKPFILGNGSNVVVSDGGMDGVVVKINGGDIKLDGELLTVGAGVTLVSASVFARENELSGMEKLYGIPGTVGGAVVMNAGAYGGEINDILVSTKYFTPDGELKEISLSEHEFGYRTSFFKKNPGTVVLESTFKLKKSRKEDICAEMNELMSCRKDKQPLDFPSAGSVFKRPEGQFAGALIEKAGLKGYTIGGAQVSEKHAGFIINVGNATCEDIKKLVEHIQKTVKDDSGFDLECEILFVGRGMS